MTGVLNPEVNAFYLPSKFGKGDSFISPYAAISINSVKHSLHSTESGSSLGHMSASDSGRASLDEKRQALYGRHHVKYNNHPRKVSFFDFESKFVGSYTDPEDGIVMHRVKSSKNSVSGYSNDFDLSDEMPRSLPEEYCITFDDSDLYLVPSEQGDDEANRQDDQAHKNISCNSVEHKDGTSQQDQNDDLQEDKSDDDFEDKVSGYQEDKNGHCQEHKYGNSLKHKVEHSQEDKNGYILEHKYGNSFEQHKDESFQEDNNANFLENYSDKVYEDKCISKDKQSRQVNVSTNEDVKHPPSDDNEHYIDMNPPHSYQTKESKFDLQGPVASNYSTNPLLQNQTLSSIKEEEVSEDRYRPHVDQSQHKLNETYVVHCKSTTTQTGDNAHPYSMPENKDKYNTTIVLCNNAK